MNHRSQLGDFCAGFLVQVTCPVDIRTGAGSPAYGSGRRVETSHKYPAVRSVTVHSPSIR